RFRLLCRALHCLSPACLSWLVSIAIDTDIAIALAGALRSWSKCQCRERLDRGCPEKVASPRGSPRPPDRRMLDPKEFLSFSLAEQTSSFWRFVLKKEENV